MYIKQSLIKELSKIMPITKSAKKALRQNKRRREHNLRYLRKMRYLIKSEKKLVLEGKKDEALSLLSKVYKVIDKAAKENVIKKNTAARKKSKIAKLVNSILSK